jgi:hypothetical protein
MEGPFNQYVVACRLTSEDAADCERAVKQVFELGTEWSEGKLSVESNDSDDVTVTTLRLPEKSPYHFCVARLDDVVLFCTKPELIRQCVEQLQDSSGESKFDDPRFKSALKQLPEAEDAIFIFDGRQLWEDLGGIGDFIREHEPNDEKAQRVAKVLDDVFKEIAFLDFVAGVEYTEDGQNRAASFGKLADNAEDTLLGKALSQGKPFEDWEKWIPADATSYSLGTGVNLYVLYDGILKYVREEFPEAHEALDKWDEIQKKVEVDLGHDILENFTGEYVSVTLPVENASGQKTAQQITALRCNNPDKIHELIERAVDGINQLPAAKGQNIELVDSEDEDLEGFQEIHANILKALGTQPVIGFQDGWMILASDDDAAKKLAAVRSGDEEAIDQAERLKQFNLEAEGPVYAVSYSDVGEGIRQAADAIDKAGMMAPMFIGMAAQGANAEQMKAVQEAIGLLPSIAKVIRKFDFYEDKLSITYGGPEDNTFMQQAVTLVRQAEDEDESAGDSE